MVNLPFVVTVVHPGLGEATLTWMPSEHTQQHFGELPEHATDTFAENLIKPMLTVTLIDLTMISCERARAFAVIEEMIRDEQNSHLN